MWSWNEITSNKGIYNALTVTSIFSGHCDVCSRWWFVDIKLYLWTKLKRGTWGVFLRVNRHFIFVHVCRAGLNAVNQGAVFGSLHISGVAINGYQSVTGPRRLHAFPGDLKWKPMRAKDKFCLDMGRQFPKAA